MSDTGNMRRRTLLKGAAASGLLTTAPLAGRFAQAQGSAPIRIGFQQHVTGIGAAYGRWYGRTTEAAVKKINDEGGINGRPVEIVAEDDFVAVRMTQRGTHEGTFMGIEPTGNAFEIEAMAFVRLEDGKIIERWGRPDLPDLLRQLGRTELPAPPA